MNNNFSQMMQGAAQGAVGAVAGQAAKNMSPQFTDQHNQTYEAVRQGLMALVQLGVPGMDRVLDQLHKTHINFLKSSQGASVNLQSKPFNMTAGFNSPNRAMGANIGIGNSPGSGVDIGFSAGLPGSPLSPYFGGSQGQGYFQPYAVSNINTPQERSLASMVQQALGDFAKSAVTGGAAEKVGSLIQKR